MKPGTLPCPRHPAHPGGREGSERSLVVSRGPAALAVAAMSWPQAAAACGCSQAVSRWILLMRPKLDWFLLCCILYPLSAARVLKSCCPFPDTEYLTMTARMWSAHISVSNGCEVCNLRSTVSKISELLTETVSEKQKRSNLSEKMKGHVLCPSSLQGRLPKSAVWDTQPISWSREAHLWCKGLPLVMVRSYEFTLLVVSPNFTFCPIMWAS